MKKGNTNYSELYRKIAPFYEEKFRGKDFTKKEVDFLSRILIKDNVLDAGCGTGRHSIPLAKIGFKVIGIDISDDMLNEAKKNANKENIRVDFFKKNITETGFPNDYFDNIICMYSVFSELTEEERKLCLKEFRRILKNNGLLVLEVPNLEAFEAIGYKNLSEKGFEPLNKPGDFIVKFVIEGEVFRVKTHLFSFHEIKDLLETFNFRIENVFGQKFEKFDNLKSQNIILLSRKLIKAHGSESNRSSLTESADFDF